MWYQWLKSLIDNFACIEQQQHRISDNIKLLGQRLLSSLPNRCLLCHLHTDNKSNGLCHTCLNACLYQQMACLSCGKSTHNSVLYCGSCLSKSSINIIAPASYHSALGNVITAFKYQQQFAPLFILVQALLSQIEKVNQIAMQPKPQVLIPVPMHSKRLQQRGFNQAYLIAEILSKYSGIPVIENKLLRTRNTPAQAGLDGKQRRKNLNNAFTLASDFPWQSVALIDDVVTTGATIHEIAKLFEKRYIHVQAWCLARAEYVIKK